MNERPLRAQQIADTVVHDDHASLAHATLTRIFSSRRLALMSDNVIRLKCKMSAIATASAPPSRITSTRWAGVPMPPLAITGTLTARAMAPVNWMSKPRRVPSRSIEVTRISPAPKGPCSLRNQFRSPHGGRIDCNLIGPSFERIRHISHCTNASADGDGDEYVARAAFDDVQQRVASVKAGHGVHVKNFIGTGFVILFCIDFRIAKLAQTFKMNCFNEIGCLNI